MVGGLLDYFPNSYTPNPGQVKLLKNIDQAFRDGYKFIVCNAPTGSGKSFISKTLANASRDASQNFKDLISSYTAFKRDHTGNYVHEQECEEEVPAGASALTILILQLLSSKIILSVLLGLIITYLIPSETTKK